MDLTRPRTEPAIAGGGDATSTATSIDTALLAASESKLPSRPRKGGPWQEGSTNVDRASRAVAAAYGCGACMAMVWHASWVEVPIAEDGTADPAGLAIHTRGAVVHDARKYLPRGRHARAAALSAFDADKRRTVEAFDNATNMRADASNPDMHASRTRRVHAWSNKASPGVVVIPAVRPVRPVLMALADADLDGPLEDWLMLYAAQQLWRWPQVELYLVALGHKRHHAREAAARLLGLGRSYKDGAASEGVRESAYRNRVRAIERVLWDWLERASYALLEELGEAGDRDWNAGDGLLSPGAGRPVAGT